MTTLTFNTHQFVKSLVASGITEPQAEALVTELSEVQITNVATKGDITDVRDEIRATQEEIRTAQEEIRSTKEEIRITREQLRIEMSQIRVDLLKWVVPLLMGQTAAFAFIVQWLVQ